MNDEEIELEARSLEGWRNHNSWDYTHDSDMCLCIDVSLSGVIRVWHLDDKVYEGTNSLDAIRAYVKLGGKLS